MRKGWENPIIFNDKTRDLINKGIGYIFGRDKSYRPIFILNLKKLHEGISSGEISVSMLRTLINKYLSYSEERLFVKGRVETWVMIADCRDLDYSGIKTVIIQQF
jgi:hypothetical protein